MIPLYSGSPIKNHIRFIFEMIFDYYHFKLSNLEFQKFKIQKNCTISELIKPYISLEEYSSLCFSINLRWHIFGIFQSFIFLFHDFFFSTNHINRKEKTQE